MNSEIKPVQFKMPKIEYYEFSSRFLCFGNFNNVVDQILIF